MPEKIDTREKFNAAIREALPTIVRENPQVVLDAIADNKDGFVESLKKAGILTSRDAASPADFRRARDEMQEIGLLPSGLGQRTREACAPFARSVRDPISGRRVTRHIHPGTEEYQLANRWMLALFSKDGRDPEGASVRELVAKLNEKVRAPATPMTGEIGTGGGFLVPTLVAADIFMELNERFVLQTLVQVFQSAAPLRIPRRISQISVTWSGVATAISEKDAAATLGFVDLSPERCSALAYIDPLLAQAAVVGPVMYVTGQFAEAVAKEYQRVIVAGVEANREPRGINTLPTSGGNAYDRAETATYTDTNNTTRRESFRSLMFKISQPHREAQSYVWIGNNDAVQKMASLNDTDQQPFKDNGPGQAPTFFGRRVVETTALTTPSTTTVNCGDMAQYAWQEAPGGLGIETTREGGEAWASGTVGIRVITHVDGAPVIPPAFGILPGVVVP